MVSILLTEKESKPSSYGIPWRNDSEAYNMMSYKPNKVIKIEGSWRDELMKESNKINSLFINSDLEEQDYEMIRSMKNLKAIYMYTAKNLKDLSFINDLLELRHLMICHSDISDLTAISVINKKQNIDSFRRLDCVALIDSKVSDLSPLKDIKCFSEFVLMDSLVPKDNHLYQEIMKFTYFTYLR